MFKTLNAQLIADFLADDLESIEELRQRRCTHCRIMAERKFSDEARVASCVMARCEMSIPEVLRAEQVWACTVLLNLCPPNRPTPADLAIFTNHLSVTGSLTLGFSMEHDGNLGLAFCTPTLRGELQAAIVGWISAMIGEYHTNVMATDGKAAKSEVGRMRKLLLDHAASENQSRAAQLRDDGVSDNQIAAQLGTTNKTLRDWLGPREDWEKNRDAWYRRNSLTQQHNKAS